MEVTSSELGTHSKAEAESESSMSNERNHTLQPESFDDDSRSSSLSDIEDGLYNEQLESINPELRKAPVEVDSEAETERMEESPSKVQPQNDIYLSSGTQEKSPSKLIYSTNAADIENERDQSDSPEQAGQVSNGSNSANKTNIVLSPNTKSRALSPPPDMAGKKRKRASAGDSNGSSDTDSDRPLRKRTGSIKSDANGNNADEMDVDDDVDDDARPAEVLDEEAHEDEVPEDEGLVDELDESDQKQTEANSKNGKKGKRKMKKVMDIAEGSRIARGDTIPEVAIDSPVPTQGEEADHHDEEEEGGEDVDDAEAAARNEEERQYPYPWESLIQDCHLPSLDADIDIVAKRMSAMDSLAAIEKQFATFRDK
jgi:hypothetical protein